MQNRKEKAIDKGGVKDEKGNLHILKIKHHKPAAFQSEGECCRFCMLTDRDRVPRSRIKKLSTREQEGSLCHQVC